MCHGFVIKLCETSFIIKAKRCANMLSQVSRPDRQAIIGLLARAEAVELSAPLERRWPGLAVRDLRKPESGLVMLRGRIGADGAPFNFGETTMTRAVVELGTGERGYGQTLGRKPGIARMAAIFDALAQRERDRDRVIEDVVQPIRKRIAAEKARLGAQTAATKVDFFTLLRGEAD